MSSSQKQEERSFLEIVLGGLGIATPPSIYDKRESPDFLLKSASGNIGVEVTQLYRETASRGSRRWEGACEGGAGVE